MHTDRTDKGKLGLLLPEHRVELRSKDQTAQSKSGVGLRTQTTSLLNFLPSHFLPWETQNQNRTLRLDHKGCVFSYNQSNATQDVCVNNYLLGVLSNAGPEGWAPPTLKWYPR